MGVATAIDTHDARISLADWWQCAGVDGLVGETPRNWLARGREAKPTHVTQPSAAAAPPLPDTLDAFLAYLATLDTGPGPALLPSGDPSSDHMVLVDMPEPGDGAAGVLLTGPAGQLFDAMLAAVGLSRAAIFLAPLLGKVPPGGRPDPAQLDQSGVLARRLISLAAPKSLLVIGDASARALFAMGLAEARSQRQFVKHGDDTIPAIVTFAPRFLLRNPLRKADSWRDLQRWAGKQEDR